MTENHEAFEELFTRYKNQVVSYAYYTLKSQQSAEELCQDAFLKLYRKSSQFDRSKKFKPWFWTLVRNTTFDHLRKKTELLYEDFNKDEDEKGFEVPDESVDIEAQLIQKMEDKHLQQLIATLPAAQKEVLLLQVFSELNYEEVASATGKSLSSVKSLLFRARKSLKELLEKENE